MPLKLSKNSEELLKQILIKHRPEMLGLVDPYQEVEVSNALLDDLRQAATDEFCETGLREDDEPTPRGLLLEDLIDELGRLQS